MWKSQRKLVPLKRNKAAGVMHSLSPRPSILELHSVPGRARGPGSTGGGHSHTEAEAREVGGPELPGASLRSKETPDPDEAAPGHPGSEHRPEPAFST